MTGSTNALTSSKFMTTEHLQVRNLTKSSPICHETQRRARRAGTEDSMASRD